MSQLTTMEAAEAEGSFSQKWEDFVEANKIPSEVAAKLQFVFYAGGASVFDAISEAMPAKNTPASVQHSVASFTALRNEVNSFFEGDEEEEDMTVLTIKEENTGG